MTMTKKYLKKPIAFIIALAVIVSALPIVSGAQEISDELVFGAGITVVMSSAGTDLIVTLDYNGIKIDGVSGIELKRDGVTINNQPPSADGTWIFTTTGESSRGRVVVSADRDTTLAVRAAFVLSQNATQEEIDYFYHLIPEDNIDNIGLTLPLTHNGYEIVGNPLTAISFPYNPEFQLAFSANTGDNIIELATELTTNLKLGDTIFLSTATNLNGASLDLKTKNGTPITGVQIGMAVGRYYVYNNPDDTGFFNSENSTMVTYYVPNIRIGGPPVLYFDTYYPSGGQLPDENGFWQVNIGFTSNGKIALAPDQPQTLCITAGIVLTSDATPSERDIFYNLTKEDIAGLFVKDGLTIIRDGQYYKEDLNFEVSARRKEVTCLSFR